MQKSFASVVQFPYLSSKKFDTKPVTDLQILQLGDCWEHIFKYLTPSDYVNLRCVSRGFNIVIQPKRLLLVWNIQQLQKLQDVSRELFVSCQQKLRKIRGVTQLEQLLFFPNLTEIKFNKHFPSNNKKQRRQLRCGFIPKYVKIIHFGGFNHFIQPGAIPLNIVEMYFDDVFNQYLDPLIFREFVCLKILKLGKSFNNANKLFDPTTFPRSLEHLEINSVYFNEDLAIFLPNLPNLTTLLLGRGFTLPIRFLPHNIRYLIVSEIYNCDLIDCIINSNLIYIKMGKGYKHYIDPEKLSRKIVLNYDIESYKEILYQMWLNKFKH